MSKDDGGPALVSFEIDNGVVRLSSQMTLRDWFAAAALQGMLSDTKWPDLEIYAVRWAYQYADAMLKERAK